MRGTSWERHRRRPPIVPPVQRRDPDGVETTAIGRLVDLAGRNVLDVVRFAVHAADALDVERPRIDLALCGWSL